MKKIDEVSKDNIFQVPEGYFNTLPQNIEKKILPKIALQDNMLKNQAFVTPANYFDELAFQIQTKVQSNSIKHRGKFLLKPKLALSLLSMVMILVLSIIFINFSPVFITDNHLSKLDNNKINIDDETISENKHQISKNKVSKLNEKPSIQSRQNKPKPLIDNTNKEVVAVAITVDTEDIEAVLENAIPTSDAMDILSWEENTEYLSLEEDLLISESDFDIY